MAITDAELDAILNKKALPPPTDTEVVARGMRQTKPRKSVGERSIEADLVEDIYGEQARKETGGSMDVFEQVDPRSEFTEEEAEQYLAGEKEITLPGSGKVQSFKPSATPAPPRLKVASQITNQDIFDLAQSGEFPDDLEHSQEDMESEYFKPAAVPLKQVYSEIQDPLDRAVFIKDRRDKVAKQRFDEIYRRELKPQLYTALAGATAAVSLAGLASMAPGAVKLLGGMSRNQLANLAVDVGVDAVFLGKDLAALYLFYDYITSDDEEEKAELEEDFEELKKEMK